MKSKGESLTPPIYRGGIFAFDSMHDLAHATDHPTEDFTYGRYDNPTVVEFEKRMAQLEGAEIALGFGSGMAAISTAVLALLPPGGRVVRQAELYGGTVELFRSLVPRLASEVVSAPACDPIRFAEEITSRGADLVYVESPVNPTLGIVDLAPIVAAAKSVGAITLFDNTFATPVGQRPIDLGVDVSLHSATKYLGGHHDLIAGALATRQDLRPKLWEMRKMLGGVLSPDDAFLLMRGLETLELRVETSAKTSADLAERLAGHPRVQNVCYPGRAEHPDHEVAKRQMTNFGSMIAFELEGGRPEAEDFLNALEVVYRAGSLGGTQSTAMLPALVSHAHLPEDIRLAMGIKDSLVRLSVGTEPVERIWNDLDRALSRKSRVAS